MSSIFTFSVDSQAFDFGDVETHDDVYNVVKSQTDDWFTASSLESVSGYTLREDGSDLIQEYGRFVSLRCTVTLHLSAPSRRDAIIDAAHFMSGGNKDDGMYREIALNVFELDEGEVDEIFPSDA